MGIIGFVLAVLIWAGAFLGARKNGVKPATFIFGVVGLAVWLIGTTIGSSFGQINSGEIGLQRAFGGFTGKVFNQGLYTTTPVITSVDVIDVQNQHQNLDMNVLTRDNQSVPMHISINYNLSQDPTLIIKTITANGDNYWERAIESQFVAAARQISSQYNLTDLNQHLDIVSNQILADTERRVRQVKGTDAIQLTQVSIKGLDLSDEYKKAIEDKVIASQAAQKAQIDQQRVQFETNQGVIKAKGQAEAQKYQSRTINDEYLKLKRIEVEQSFLEHWDGHCSMLGGCPDFSEAGSGSNGARTASGPIIVDARNLAEAMATMQKSDESSNNNSSTPTPSDSPDPQASPG